MIISLVGYPGSGKDTIAGILAQEHGFTQVAFADPLRSIAYAINPLIPESHGVSVIRLQELIDEIGWRAAKDNYPEVRRFLEAVGTEGLRDNISDTIWIDLAMQKMSDVSRHYVISDMRFPNEYDAVKQLEDSFVWYVERPEASAAAAEGLSKHASAAYYDTIPRDDRIVNDGDLADLADKVDQALFALTNRLG